MLKTNRIDLIEVGGDKPFKVMYEGDDGSTLLMSMLCKADNLSLLDEDGGKLHYHIESRSLEEVEPEVFAYVVRVRKFRPIWRSAT